MVRNTRLSFFFFLAFYCLILAERVLITRGSQASCDFALVINLSIGLVSAVATSHKQIIKTRNARHRAFWVSRQHRQRLFIHPLFIVRWRIAKYF